MRPTRWALSLLAVACQACASTGTPEAMQTFEPPAASTAPTIPVATADVALNPDFPPADAAIVVKRRGGVGAVLFELSLSANGSVSYEGVNLVDTRGTRSGAWDGAEFNAAWSALVGLDRDHRAELDACEPVSNDGPTAYVVTLTGGGGQVLFHGDLDRPCPDNAALAQFVAQYDAIVDGSGARAWVGDSVR